jgi:hypothetical protein
MSRLPCFLHSRLAGGGEVVSLTLRPLFTPQDDSSSSLHQGCSTAGRIRQIEREKLTSSGIQPATFRVVVHCLLTSSVAAQCFSSGPFLEACNKSLYFTLVYQPSALLGEPISTFYLIFQFQVDPRKLSRYSIQLRKGQRMFDFRQS